MHRTKDFVDLLVAATPAKSKYAAAKILGVPNQSINDWTNRGRVMSDTAGLKTAEILGLNPCYVVACLAAERASPEALEECWRDICELIPTTRTAPDMRKSIVFLRHRLESLEKPRPGRGNRQSVREDSRISH